MFLSFPYGKHCFQCQFLFSRCKLCLRYTAGKFDENPSMRALAKILRTRASEHSSNFCEQFEQRPNFASTFKFDWTILYPWEISLSRGLKIAHLYKRNVSGRVTLLPWTELRPVSFNKRQQNEEAFFQKHSWRAHVSPMFSSFPYG